MVIKEQSIQPTLPVRNNIFTYYGRKLLAGLTEILSKEYQLTPNEIRDLMLETGYADAFERLDQYLILGRTEMEIADFMVEKSSRKDELLQNHQDMGLYCYDADYWFGWILGMLIFERGYSFRDIFAHISPDELKDSYYPLHEINEDYAMDEIVRRMGSEYKNKMSLQKI